MNDDSLCRHGALAALAALAGACLWAVGLSNALAQAAPLPVLPGDSAPAASASAPDPARARPAPRLLSPAETGNRAAAPGELRPERPVAKPQISIPLGKKPVPPTAREERAVRRGEATTVDGVDDAAARCEAQTDERARADCRARLAKRKRAALPN